MVSGDQDGGQNEVSSTSTLSTMLVPELIAVLDKLAEISLSGTPGDTLGINAPDRAKELCQAVQSKSKLVFQAGDGAIFKHIFHLLFSSSASVRKGARMFMEAAKETPKDFQMSDISGQFGADCLYHKWMLTEILAGNVDGLKAWQVTIRLLGKLVHVSSGTALLNTLLSIAEKGFKSEDILLRRETFNAWQVLIDNFATNQTILLHPKRIRLITRPLVANNNMNKEPLARAKFNTWWHFICTLGSNVTSNIDSVIVPFLEFCYGKYLTDGTAAPAKGHAPSSPVKKFSAMSSHCLEAFAQILNCPVKNRVLRPLGLKSNLLESKDVVAHHHAILYAMTEAFASLNLTSGTDSAEKFEAIFSVISNMIHSIESSDKPENIKTVTVFLTSVHKVVVQNKQNPRVQSVILTMLEEVRKLPSNILFSKSYWSLLEQPLVAMLKLLLDRDLLPLLSSDCDKLKKQYAVVLQGFLKKGCASKMNALPLLEEMTKQLEDSVSALSEPTKGELAASLWKTLASFLKEHIDRNQEINQVKSTIDHNLGACSSILAFPLRHLAQDSHRNVWKQWIDLYAQVSAATALVESYKPLEMEGFLCEIMVQQLRSVDGPAILDVFSKIFFTGIVKEMPLKTMTDANFGKNSMESIIGVATGLIGKVLTRQSDRDGGTFAGNVCNAVSILLSLSTSQELIKLLLKKLVPCLAPLLKAEVLEFWGRTYSEAAESVFNNVLTLIQSRYSGSFDRELLKDVLPFFTATMSHQKRHLKQKAQQMWQVTFAPKILLADIPPEISLALRKSLILSSESSQSTNDDDNSPGLSFGSFLKRDLPVKPDIKETTATPSPFKNFKKPEKEHKKGSLEDENTQDFVPITNSGKKKHYLTEHQKERFTTRSDDIPALYSELSRDDSQQMIPAQFSSQQHDDSSQAAMDESVFDKLVNERKSRTKGSEARKRSLTAEMTNASQDSDTDSLNRSLRKKTESRCLRNKIDTSPKRRPSVDTSSERPPTVDLSSSNDTDAESVTSVENSGSKRRKGRPPIKNLPPLAKRQSGSGPSESPLAKRARGRPRKIKPAEVVAVDVVKDVEANEVKMAAEADGAKTLLMEMGSERAETPPPSQPSGVPDVVALRQEVLRQEVLPSVKIARLSPNQDDMVKSSPVKIIQENPLVITYARDEGEQSETGAEKRNSSDWDSEMIQSSQSSDELFLARGRKRKRESTNATLSDKSTNPQIEDGSVGGGENDGSQKVQKAKRSIPLRGPADKENLIASQQQQLAKRAAKNKYGESPLHVAVKRGDLAKVKSLLEKGADVRARDHAGWTPIHESIRENNDSLAILRVLLDNGADINVQSEDGNTPLHDAVNYMSDRIIQFLMENGADPKVVNQRGQTPMDLAPVRLMPLLSGGIGKTSQQQKSSPKKIADHFNGEEDKSTKSQVVTDMQIGIKGIAPLAPEEEIASESGTTGVIGEMQSELQAPVAVADGNDDIANSPSGQSPPRSISRNQDKLQVFQRRATLPFSGRGAKLLEMSKAKGHLGQFLDKEESAGGAAPLMSPRVMATSNSNLPVSIDNLATPTNQNRKPKAWEKFQPSPSDASPSAGILKKFFSENDKGSSAASSPSEPPPIKRRRVQFMDPPVSEKVEIPRCASSGAKSVRQRLAVPRFSKDIPLVKSLSNESQEDSSSVGLYESTPPVDVSAKEAIYPGLVNCDEPITSILGNLANQAWQKGAEKSLSEHGITKISHLSKLTSLEALNLKCLKPPNNVATIQQALRKFERKMEGRMNSSDLENGRREGEEVISKKIAPVVDISTPEEDEQTMQELYERPSPSPTELGGDLPPSSSYSSSATTSTATAIEDVRFQDIGPPPPLICLRPERGTKPPRNAVAAAAAFSELNIPTIVDKYASPSKRVPSSTPRELWSLSQTSSEPRVVAATKSLQHKECQITPSKVETADVECLTDEKEFANVEIQAVQASFSKETQTRVNEREEDFAEVMKKVDNFDSKMLSDVMEKCLMLLRSKL